MFKSADNCHITFYKLLTNIHLLTIQITKWLRNDKKKFIKNHINFLKTCHHLSGTWFFEALK
jgi:hypothetical protein